MNKTDLFKYKTVRCANMRSFLVGRVPSDVASRFCAALDSKFDKDPSEEDFKNWMKDLSYKGSGTCSPRDAQTVWKAINETK